jgi:hypothetical protein
VDDESIVRLDADRVTWRRVDDTLVVLDLDASAYLAINDAGSVVWERLAEGATRSELLVAMLDVFDVDEPTASADLDQFLGDLDSRGLLHAG